MWNEIWEAVQPGLLTIIQSLIALVMGYITVKLPPAARLWFETKQRDHLQLTMLNGARMALEGKLSGEMAVKAIIDYTMQGAKDAVAYFTPSTDRLRDMAMAKLQQAASAAFRK